MKLPMDYTGKRVVVSGCYSGMGEATARLLLELGAEVHGLDYKACSLPLASFTKADLREISSIDAAVAALEGPIDGLFNCAGLPEGQPPLDIMRVNVIGTRYLTSKVMAKMAPGSAVATIASTGGLGWSQRIPLHMELVRQTTPESMLRWCEEHAREIGSGYVFSKEALILWTMAESMHSIARGIRMNCILPGPTQTPMMSAFEAVVPDGMLEAGTRPINRRAQPEEQGAPLVFLNCPGASFINGVALPVDGGFCAGLSTGQIDYSALVG